MPLKARQWPEKDTVNKCWYSSSHLSFRIGYNIAIFARTDLYDLLLARIPPGKIHFNKKVIAIDQNENGTRITCSDGTSYSGDILVGADGAYSGVRQELYKQMQEMRILPAVDTQAMDKGFICMVGTTRPLDPSEYPGVDDEVANINQIIGRNSSYCVRTGIFFFFLLSFVLQGGLATFTLLLTPVQSFSF